MDETAKVIAELRRCEQERDRANAEMGETRRELHRCEAERDAALQNAVIEAAARQREAADFEQRRQAGSEQNARLIETNGSLRRDLVAVRQQRDGCEHEIAKCKAEIEQGHRELAAAAQKAEVLEAQVEGLTGLVNRRDRELDQARLERDGALETIDRLSPESVNALKDDLACAKVDYARANRARIRAEAECEVLRGEISAPNLRAGELQRLHETLAAERRRLADARRQTAQWKERAGALEADLQHAHGLRMQEAAAASDKLRDAVKKTDLCERAAEMMRDAVDEMHARLGVAESEVEERADGLADALESERFARMQRAALEDRIERALELLRGLNTDAWVVPVAQTLAEILSPRTVDEVEAEIAEDENVEGPCATEMNPDEVKRVMPVWEESATPAAEYARGEKFAREVTEAMPNTRPDQPLPDWPGQRMGPDAEGPGYTLEEWARQVEETGRRWREYVSEASVQESAMEQFKRIGRQIESLRGLVGEAHREEMARLASITRRLD